MAGVHDLARLTGLTDQQVSDIFDGILNLIRNGERVIIRDFGSFFEITQKQRTVISSAIKGGRANVPEARVLRFKPSQSTRIVVKSRGKAKRKGEDA